MGNIIVESATAVITAGCLIAFRGLTAELAEKPAVLADGRRRVIVIHHGLVAVADAVICVERGSNEPPRERHAHKDNG